MYLVSAIVGLLLLSLVATDAFNTILLPRRIRHAFRIAPLFYTVTWRMFGSIARRVTSSHRRESFLSIYGPLSLLTLFGIWAAGIVVSCGLLQWAAGMQPAAIQGTLGNDIYLSGSAFFTLTSGDPKNGLSKFIAVIESGFGLAFLGLVIGYLPVVYQAFSRRELQITLLDARAGSPPSAGVILQWRAPTPESLEKQLAAWEEWEAQLLESQLSFPMLAYFRSQHPNQSWLTALVAVVDSAAVVSLTSSGSLQRQADLTFAMGRHVLAEIAVVFRLEAAPEDEATERLSGDDFSEIRRLTEAAPDVFDTRRLSRARLLDRRKFYESQAFALGRYFMMAVPPWLPNADTQDNWRIPITDRDEVPFAVSDPFAQPADPADPPDGP